MATVGITRPRVPQAIDLMAPGEHPKAILEAEKGTKLVIPYAPQGSELGGLADVWEQQTRPGRQALNLHTGKALPTMGLVLNLARPDHQTSVEDLIAKLRDLGKASERVVLSNMSAHERGPWRITALTITGTARQEGSNRITRATATLALTAASDALGRRGPLSGGKAGKDGKLTRYTVKKGDTLRRIAAKPNVYGSPDKWQRLAKANNIKRKPGYELEPGLVLKVPR